MERSSRARGASAASRAIVAVTAALAVSIALAGCVPQTTGAAPTQSPAASASASAAPTTRLVPALVPNGTAAENAPYFRAVGVRLLQHNQDLKGRPIVDAFVKAGFEKKNMELTPDKTSIGLDAWNIEWSVKFGDSCIIGQAGNTRFHYFTGPVLSTGKCLFGTTRPITW